MRKTMSNNFYNDYVRTKSFKSTRLKIKKTAILVIMCLLLFSVVIGFSINKIRSKKETFNKEAYLVIVGKYINVANAKDMADKVETSGGAGFIWVEDEFWVVAFVYPSQSAAESVQSQLRAASWRAEIEKKEIKKVNNSKLTNSQKFAVELMWKLMNEFYEFALVIDESENENAKVHKNLSKIRQDILLASNNLGESDIDAILRERLNLLSEELQSFLQASYPKNLYTSGIKSICVKAVYSCVGLADELDKLL